jgi:hypothetical protein
LVGARLRGINNYGDRHHHVRKRVRYLLKSGSANLLKFIGYNGKLDTGSVVGMKLGVSRALNIKARESTGSVLPSGHRQVTHEMLEAADARDRLRQRLKDRFSVPLNHGSFVVGSAA